MFHRFAARLACAVVLPATFLIASPAIADTQVSVVNLFNSAEYVPNSWVPLRIILSNNNTGEAIDGEVTAALPSDAGGTLNLVAPVLVPPQSRLRTTVYAPLGQGEPSAPVRNNQPPRPPKPVAIVELRQGVSKVAQSDIVLLAAGAQAGESAVDRSAFIEISQGDLPDLDSYDTTPVRKVIADVIGGPVIMWSTSPDGAATHPIAYDSCRVVMLGATDPKLLSVAQQDAILAYVRSGGTLLICSPETDSIRGSWLASVLPVDLIGNRLAATLPTATGSPAVPLRESVRIAEATEKRGSTVLMGDSTYVHAAYRPLGLGRVVFTSFPITAPTLTDEILRSLWTPLLGLNQPTTTLDASQLTAERRGEVLREMIGKPAPSRMIAVALAAGFAILVLLTQLVWRGARRPIGFAVASGAAVVMAVVLAGSRWLTQTVEPLAAGRVSVMKFDAGSGFIQETVAYTGSVPDLALSTENPSAVLKPISFDAAYPPTLSVSPFAAPDARAAAGRIDRVWQADASVPVGITATATGRFDATGLRLDVRNELGAALEAPVLVTGPSVYRLPNLGTGEQTVTVTADTRNPAVAASANASANDPSAVRARASKFMNTGAIVGEVDLLRASVMSAAFSTQGVAMSGMGGSGFNFEEDEDESDDDKPKVTKPAVVVSPVRTAAPVAQLSIAGWLAAPGAAPAVVKPSVQPAVERSLVLATFPINIEPSEPGSIVRIDSGFNTLVNGPMPIPVYDPGTGTWLSSSQPGSWLIGFRPPAGVAPKLVPTKVTIHANLQLPAQKFTLRRGQVRNGRLGSPNMMGEPVAEWANVFTAQAPVTFDATPADFDNEGVVWFLLDVEITSAAGGVVPLWSVSELGATIEGRAEEEMSKNEDGG